MSVTNEEKFYKLGSGDLKISTDEWRNYSDMGLLKEVKLSVTNKLIERKADNGNLPPKMKVDEAVLSAKLYKIDLESIGKLSWVADFIKNNGEETSVTAEVIGDLQKDGIYSLSNKNSDNTKVSNIVVKSGETELTIDTDYKVFVNNQGKTTIMVLSEKTALTVDYSYTKTASKELVFKAIAKSLNLYNFRFETKDELGKLFGIEFFKAYNKWNLEFSFVPDESEEMMGYNIEIKASADSENRLFRIFDEQTA